MRVCVYPSVCPSVLFVSGARTSCGLRSCARQYPVARVRMPERGIFLCLFMFSDSLYLPDAHETGPFFALKYDVDPRCSG